MADIKFKCIYCAQPLEAPEDLVGLETECPRCKKSIIVPRPAVRFFETQTAIKQEYKQSQDSPTKSEQATRTPTRNMRALRNSIIFAVLLLMYFVWPYWSIYRFNLMIKSQNTDAISDEIDFPSLRASVKEQITLFSSEIFPKDSENKTTLFSGLASVLCNQLTETLVNELATPSGLKPLLAGKLQDENTTASEGLRDITYAFFRNPTTFLVKTKESTLIFRLRDWTWKLSEIRLKKKAFEELAESFKKEKADEKTEVSRDSKITLKSPKELMMVSRDNDPHYKELLRKFRTEQNELIKNHSETMELLAKCVTRVRSQLPKGADYLTIKKVLEEDKEWRVLASKEQEQKEKLEAIKKEIADVISSRMKQEIQDQMQEQQ